MIEGLRVALIHDWLTGMRGGEKALEVFCEMFPAADLFTLVHLPGTTSPVIERRTVKGSMIQWLPFAGRLYRQYLPLFPVFPAAGCVTAEPLLHRDAGGG